MEKLRIVTFLFLLCSTLSVFAQDKLPDRKVIVYTQYERVGPKESYRDLSLVKQITLRYNIAKDKREKIEAIVKENAEKIATKKLLYHSLVLSPEEHIAVVRVKLKSINDVIFHEFQYWKYKTEDELNKKKEEMKYWMYQSHEIVYQEASLTSTGENNEDYYNQMLNYFKSFFETDKPESKELIETFKDGYTGTRG